MRVMLRAQLDTQMSNEAIKNGTLPKVMQSMTEQLKPEAAYFVPTGGGRSCTFVFDMQDSSLLPTIAEPLCEGLGAKIEIQPVMNSQDLQKGNGDSHGSCSSSVWAGQCLVGGACGHEDGHRDHERL
ncbi:hypothetical protein [Streptomyces sp. NBC_01017]|uniref:hypothetical protein n=1 Tax=Streptomyces sp. NBC_01017 TaxID=2903721 RepID=UPI003865D4E1